MSNVKSNFTVRLSDDEYEKIYKLAEEGGYVRGNTVNVSAFMRDTSLNQGNMKRIIIIEDLKPFNIELRRIGNNINQLAKLANMGKLSVVDLQAIKRQLNELMIGVNEIGEKDQFVNDKIPE